jgi:CheY-like chemotaxis protein/class 3 adenylate cyclase
MSAKILVVDDNPRNIKLLAELLKAEKHEVITAESGKAALKLVAAEKPDLVLLDVMMPGMNGYEVCQAIRADPATAILPVVLVTALDPQERIKGLQAGADDFLTKPVNQPELLARVKSLLRIKSLYDTVQRQSGELAQWNRTLETRVAEQVTELERLSKLRRFVSPKVCDLILAGEIDDINRVRRREISVVFTDLRGFTAFNEIAEPEEVMGVLREYHETLGRIIMAHDGTIEHVAGDGVMVLLNDPAPIADHELAAVRMGLEMRGAVEELAAGWKKFGHELGFGVGIASGYATMGAVGIDGRRDYVAAGTVCNLAARLCSEAKSGQILLAQRAYAKIENRVRAEPIGELTLKGLHRAVPAFNILGLQNPA